MPVSASFTAALAFAALALVLLVKYLGARQRVKELTDKYSRIIDIDETAEKKSAALQELQGKYGRIDGEYKERDEELNANYQQKRAVYERLLHEISIIEETLEFSADGLYSPHYDYDTPEKYKEKLDETRQGQKQMVRDKQAVVCATEWTVQGSAAEGRKLTKQYTRLMLRAFNGESDAAVLKVRWNNIHKMEERLKKAFELINACGASHNISVTPGYLDLKLQELRLAYEHEQQKQRHKEEQRRVREEMREEEKARLEIEKSQKAAEADEKRYSEALDKARAEVADAQGIKMEKLHARIAEMERRLEEARQNKERALSRAQLTRSGHVYVISNIGSFGDDVSKIGMTRRLEPLDRVKELGDASVPFRFDVHAMIFSEDAPTLEAELHRAFEGRRLNLVNQRKEFFRVSLDELKQAARGQDKNINFTELAEAREYRETLAMIEARANKKTTQQVAEQFPEAL